jgi:hypothetical protein
LNLNSHFHFQNVDKFLFNTCTEKLKICTDFQNFFKGIDVYSKLGLLNIQDTIFITQEAQAHVNFLQQIEHRSYANMYNIFSENNNHQIPNHNLFNIFQKKELLPLKAVVKIANFTNLDAWPYTTKYYLTMLNSTQFYLNDLLLNLYSSLDCNYKGTDQIIEILPKNQLKFDLNNYQFRNIETTNTSLYVLEKMSVLELFEYCFKYSNKNNFNQESSGLNMYSWYFDTLEKKKFLQENGIIFKKTQMLELEHINKKRKF